jgi:hypothetical protein
MILTGFVKFCAGAAAGMTPRASPATPASPLSTRLLSMFSSPFSLRTQKLGVHFS